MRIFFLFISIFLPCLSSAEDLASLLATQGESTFQVPPLPTEEANEFFDKLLTGDVVQVPSEEREEVGFEEKYRLVWASNRSAAYFSINSVEVIFAPPEDEEQREALSKKWRGREVAFEPFSIHIHIVTKGQKPGIIIRHSHPLKKEERGGFRFPYATKTSWAGFVDGNNRPGAAVILPRGISEGFPPMAICPRVSKGNLSQLSLRRYLSSGYTADGIRAEMDGGIDTHLYSGLGRGEILTHLATIGSLSPSTPNYDKVFSHDPSIRLLYQSETPPAVKPFMEHLHLTGLQATFLLKNFAGYGRKVIRRSVLWGVKQEVDKERRFLLGGGSAAALLGSGECVLLYPKDYLREERFQEKKEGPEKG